MSENNWHWHPIGTDLPGKGRVKCTDPNCRETKAREYAEQEKKLHPKLCTRHAADDWMNGYREGMEEAAKVEVEAPMGVSGPFEDGWYASKHHHAKAIREKIK